MESVLKVVHPDDQEAFVAAYERSRRPESGGDYAVEHRILLPDGSERILRHQAKVTFDETGKPVRIFGTSQDVTEARLSERALRESEARFQTLIETVPDAVVVHVDGRYVYANPAALDLLGLASADAIIGKDAVSIVHPDSRELVRERIRRHQLGEPVPRKTEQRWLRSDGTAIDVEVTGIPFLLNGKRAVHVMAHDITERKRADQELRLAATAFESHEGIFITDSKGRILRANRAFTEITGYSSQEAAGRSASMLSSEQHDLAFPLAVQAALDDVGTWQGEIDFRRSSGELYPVWQSITAVKRDDGQVTHFVCHFQDISERKQVQARIEHLAYHDPLTLLPNRSMLLDRLQHALARNRRRGLYGALLFMDLDRFKNINDSLGHRTGDLLLREVGSCVAREIRDEDTVARLGGDEFVVLLADLGQNRDAAAREARAFAERIHAAVSRNFNVAGYTLRVGASIGVTVFPVADETADDILRHADIAMYRAKAAGRGTVCFFSPDMQAAASERLELEGQLRHALERGEFTLHFQPQVEFSTGRIRGAESLMRWTHPQRGALSPGLFVPVLEESGLILPAGEWVLRSACRTASLLTRFRADLRVAVNVSPRQLHQSSFAEGVRSILHECSIRPEAIELEITEGAVIQDVDDTVKVMTALKDLGVRFSLDDFGTGYSSLSYVKRLPLDTLKIDRAFVRDCTTDPNDAAIVRAIIAMAHSLDLDVIAEGVEQDAQHRFLRELGCTAYQGFLFSPPLPEGQFLSLLRSGGAGHEGGG
jgi:diguanylate cyclase (GGDEF)-like protein/PAS domain S-box-containing protein